MQQRIRTASVPQVPLAEDAEYSAWCDAMAERMRVAEIDQLIDDLLSLGSSVVFEDDDSEGGK